MKVITLIALLSVMFLGVIYGVFYATGDTPSDMDGKIVGVCQNDQMQDLTSSNSILVDGVITDGNQHGNVSVIVTNETQIFKKQGNKQTSSSFNNFKPGQKVEIQFSGPIMESYPPQVCAGQIVIVD
ncbi:DUF3221 domain-containing protein [Methanobacterium aggregans]|uniref:DUF3221 domain-containing protein n=1 Tax=Methanobacterium aggregans TaxID=1615586 RepID=UPI001AE8594C|nr:DUF3221 domain-containing protein [Methanobacterium aggregans]MBP2046433.1 hypothetical protein [Methanobacterium aggregans]